MYYTKSAISVTRIVVISFCAAIYRYGHTIWRQLRTLSALIHTYCVINQTTLLGNHRINRFICLLVAVTGPAAQPLIAQTEKVLRYRIGIFRGKKVMMAAVHGYPKGSTINRCPVRCWELLRRNPAQSLGRLHSLCDLEY